MKIQYQHRKQKFHSFISTNNTYPLHLHKHVELALVLSGAINVTVNKTENTLSEGDITLIFPNQPHSYRTAEASRILLFFIDADYPGDYAVQDHISFRDYLNSRRSALAQIMLQSTSQPVTDIAFDSGFNSLRSFYRAFRKEYGITPNDFRSHTQGTLRP